MKFGIDDRYEFDPNQDRLGESPHSEVFRARDCQLDRDVALKILRANSEIDPAAAERFSREARNTGGLNHPNIGMVYDFATLRGGQFDHFDGASYIAMEFLHGRTLGQLLQQRSLSYEEGLRCLEQLTDALATVHETGLIHRDLKPANVMLLEDGTAKLLDFGISRIKGEMSLTQEGVLVGTVLYMSPEQVRGADLDGRSDLFSLGSVLYHALTQALPFPGRTFPEVCMAILDGRPKPPSQIRSGFPPALEQFILRCMSADPELRFPSARAAHGALLEVRNSMRAVGRSALPDALQGRLFLLPLTVIRKPSKDESSQNGSEHGALAQAKDDPQFEAAKSLARGVVQDLEVSLARSTKLDLVRLRAADFATSATLSSTVFTAPREGDLMLRGALTVDGTEATLDYEVGCREPDANHKESTSGGHGLHSPVSRDPSGGSWKTLWSDRVAHEDENDFGLQAHLALALARTLRRRLADEPRAPKAPPKYDTHKARAITRRSHDILHKSTSRHLMLATSGFRKAVQIDPTCALAHAGLAESLVYKYLMWDGDSSFLAEAQDEAHRAMDLDPNCPEAHTSLGFAYSMLGRGDDARSEWQLAIQLDHGEWLAHRLLGARYARHGNFAQAIALLNRAIDLKPVHLAAYDHLYSALDQADRYTDALVIADKGVQRGQRHLELVPDDQDVRLHLTLLLARRGSKDDAIQEAKRAQEMYPKDGYTLFHLACAYSLCGDVTRALQLLSEAQSRGYYIQSELHSNSDLDPLRGNPKFDAI
jgi:serine/threonine protein kinase/tetratricopeptide (TPR) repeat protein